MKRRTQRRAGGGTAARTPREIHVRMPSPRPADTPPDVWVVNGRVIRFLDPQRPEEASPSGGHAHHRLGGLLGALRHGRRHGSADARG